MSDQGKPRIRLLRKTDEERPEVPAVAGQATVFCRRIRMPLTVADHRSCPYCFGEAKDVSTGDHSKFCDFEEGKDPICFGFPWT